VALKAQHFALNKKKEKCKSQKKNAEVRRKMQKSEVRMQK